MCERDPGCTEKVRRTVKILGDRRVFSLRFVGDVLSGLDAYRSGSGGAPPLQPQSTGTSNNRPTSNPPQPVVTPQAAKSSPPQPDDSDSDEDLFGDEEDDNAFGDSGPSLLNVSNFTVNKAAIHTESARQSQSSFGSKRRRSLQSKGGTSPNPKKSKSEGSKKRPQALSSSSFMERIQQLEELDAQYQSISNLISSITSSDLFTSTTDEIHEVGDELTDLHTEVNAKMDMVKNQRRALHHVAEGKKEVEMELQRYLVWMKGALTADEDELKLCNGLEEKLGLLQVVHADAKNARDDKRAKEAKERAKAEEAARRKAEEEELKRSLEKMQQEKNAPKAGMVWNKQAREYQYLADATTQESWRD